MPKKIKIFIPLFFIFIFNLFFQTTYAKYVIEDLHVVAKLDIDRCKPNIELIDIVSSNTNYSTYANQTHLITGHIKITEKNIIRNNVSVDTMKIAVSKQDSITDGDYITPEFKSFFIVSENSTEKIYEFSFSSVTGDGTLSIFIPEGIVEDKSRLNQ